MTPEDEIKRLRDRVDDLTVRLTAGDGRILTCAFCGHQYPDGTPVTKHQLLTEHVYQCWAHPLRKVFIEYLKNFCARHDDIDMSIPLGKNVTAALIEKIDAWDEAREQELQRLRREIETLRMGGGFSNG